MFGLCRFCSAPYTLIVFVSPFSYYAQIPGRTKDNLHPMTRCIVIPSIILTIIGLCPIRIAGAVPYNSRHKCNKLYIVWRLVSQNPNPMTTLRVSRIWSSKPLTCRRASYAWPMHRLSRHPWWAVERRHRMSMEWWTFILLMDRLLCCVRGGARLLAVGTVSGSMAIANGVIKHPMPMSLRVA